MRVRVTQLRQGGRNSKRAEASEQAVGDLELSTTMRGSSELHRVARVCVRHELSAHSEDQLAPLHAPELIAVGRDSLLLRGFESVGDAAHVQEWHCAIVKDEGI